MFNIAPKVLFIVPKCKKTLKCLIGKNVLGKFCSNVSCSDIEYKNKVNESTNTLNKAVFEQKHAQLKTRVCGGWSIICCDQKLAGTFSIFPYKQ